MGMRTHERGFSLIEVMVAVALLVTAIAGVAQLSIVSARANEATRSAATIEWLAREKLEQLTALAWTADDAVLPVSDYATNVAQTPIQSAGGFGLSLSPSDSLASAVAGYVDYLDAAGQWVGQGGSPPRAARWQRRWRIEALTGQPDTVVIQVVVSPLGRASAVIGRDAAATNGAWLVSVRSRRSR